MKMWETSPDVDTINLKMKNNNKKGMAMIAAIMTAFIFLALVSTLCLLATSGTRQANYAKRATIALHLAEAGIADALYRLNYPPYGNYPFDGSKTPFNPTALGAVTTYPGSLEGGSYEVEWNSGTKRIISTGTYKGTKRKLSVQIRGETASVNRQNPEQGIPEAFNKHTVYAGTISGSGTYSITGNLCAVNIGLAGAAIGQYTETTIPSALSGVCQADTDITFPDEPTPTDTAYGLYFCAHNGTGYAYGKYYTGLDDAVTTDTRYALPHAGISYNSGADAYTFADTQIDYSFYIQQKLGGGSGNLTFTTGGGSPNKASKFVKADGAITISDDINTDTAMATDSSAFMANSITVNADVNGDLIIKDIPDAGITLAGGITIKGTLAYEGSVANTTLTLSNNITIDPTASGGSREAAIIGYSETGNLTITINAVPTITLGSVQKRAIIVYSSGGDATIKIGDTVDVDLTGNDWGSKAAVVTCSKNNDAYVYLGSAANAKYAKVKGAIYSFGNGAGNITLEHASTEVTGALLANGTVTLSAGTLSWDERPFVDATNTDTEIYQGFTGGRRVYLPVLGSWRQE